MQMNLFQTSETSARTDHTRRAMARPVSVTHVDRPAPQAALAGRSAYAHGPSETYEEEIERWDGLY